MEFNEELSIITKIILIILVVFISCNSRIQKINCAEINKKSAYFINQHYLADSKNNLDSALFYINRGIDYCGKYKNILSLRKLGVLAEQQRYLFAIEFITTFDKEMFSDLPYYQKLLMYRFKSMEATKVNDINERNTYLDSCVIIIDNYLLANKCRMDSLLKQSHIENILNNPLSTTFTQYYYYQSVNNHENVLNNLQDMKKKKNINNEFIDYIIDYLQTNYMEFNGI